MATIALITAFHARGMADSAGSPGVEIATKAIERWGDGSWRFTDANGKKRRIVPDAETAALFEVIFGVGLFHNE